MKLRLYYCTPLEAHITEEQCEANQKRAENAARLSGRRCGGVGTGAPTWVPKIGQKCLIWLRPCLDCPGVRALARRNGEEPRVEEVAKRAQPTPVHQVPSHLLGRRLDMSLRGKRKERREAEEEQDSAQDAPKPGGPRAGNWGVSYPSGRRR